MSIERHILLSMSIFWHILTVLQNFSLRCFKIVNGNKHILLLII